LTLGAGAGCKRRDVQGRRATSQHEEWDPLLVAIAVVACRETADGWIATVALADVCAGLARHARHALGAGWAQAAAERGLVETRAQGGRVELRPKADLLTLLARMGD
jgi:hypothetical protein